MYMKMVTEHSVSSLLVVAGRVGKLVFMTACPISYTNAYVSSDSSDDVHRIGFSSAAL